MGCEKRVQGCLMGLVRGDKILPRPDLAHVFEFEDVIAEDIHRGPFILGNYFGGRHRRWDSHTEVDMASAELAIEEVDAEPFVDLVYRFAHVNRGARIFKYLAVVSRGEEDVEPDVIVDELGLDFRSTHFP